MRNLDNLISIIMPSYNAAMYISKSIESVIAQTYHIWELIIVDDCSTDSTDAVVGKYLNDERIRYFKNDKNCGAALSRNKALKKAKGRWIAFLDSDDLWLPQKLEKQLLFMKTHNYSFTFTDYRTCINGNWLPYICTGPDFVNRRMMYDYCYFFTCTVMYDRDKIGLIQIKDLKKNNDYAMWLKVIEKANAYRLPECLTYYIKHDDSISSGSKIKLIKWHYILFKHGMDRSVMTSVLLTFNNLVHGIWKKVHYKKVTNDAIYKF